MGPRVFIPAACLLASSLGCSSAPKTAKIKTPPAPVVSKGGVKVAMERQVRVAHEVRNAVDAGEGDLEARRLREQLVASPGNLDVRLQLAARYEELDMPELATEHYRLAAERFPAEVTPQIRLARTLHRKGRTAEAAASLENYLAAYPEAPAEVHSWAGIFRDALGHHKVAEHHHRDALARSGSAAYLHNNLGQNLAQQARESEAIVEHRAALALDPSNVFARNNLAMLLADKPAEARQVLEAGTNDPAGVHNNMAAILIEQGRYSEARKELNLALGYKPDHAQALSNLALVSDLDGKPAQLQAAKPGSTPKSGATFQSKVGHAFAGVFTHTETRYPEQTAAASHPPSRMKGKRPSDGF